MAKRRLRVLSASKCAETPSPATPSPASRAKENLDRQIPLYRRQEENRDIDRKAQAPQDRAQRRAVAEIGEDVGDPHDQKQHRELVDQPQRAEAEFRQQHRDRKERKRLDA